MKEFLGCLLPFTLWLQSSMIEITPDYQPKASPPPISFSVQFFRCRDRLLTLASIRNSRYFSKNAARPVASCCTALGGISLFYVNQPFPCIPQITSAGHAIDWETIGRACLQAGRTPLSDDTALYTTSNILRDPREVHDKRGDSTSPVYIPL